MESQHSPCKLAHLDVCDNALLTKVQCTIAVHNRVRNCENMRRQMGLNRYVARIAPEAPMRGSVCLVSIVAEGMAEGAEGMAEGSA